MGVSAFRVFPMFKALGLGMCGFRVVGFRIRSVLRKITICSSQGLCDPIAHIIRPTKPCKTIS